MLSEIDKREYIYKKQCDCEEHKVVNPNYNKLRYIETPTFEVVDNYTVKGQESDLKYKLREEEAKLYNSIKESNHIINQLVLKPKKIYKDSKI